MRSVVRVLTAGHFGPAEAINDFFTAKHHQRTQRDALFRRSTGEFAPRASVALVTLATVLLARPTGRRVAGPAYRPVQQSKALQRPGVTSTGPFFVDAHNHGSVAEMA